MKKFTLRDLFWLVLVAGILCAWWLDRSHLLGKNEALQEKLSEFVNEDSNPFGATPYQDTMPVTKGVTQMTPLPDVAVI